MSQHELSEMEEVELESTANSLSIYRGGTVDQDVGTTDIKLAIFASIVCQDDYWHLSPEELRFLDLKIHLDPPRWEISYEEERLRYYLDYGLTSNPQFSPPTPTPAFSVSSRIKSTSSDSESSNLGLGCPIPPTVVEESATGTCSSCAAKLDAGVESDEEVEAASEESGSGSESDRDTPTSSTSRHSDTREKKKRKGISRRVRQLEKTVENLLSLALTEPQDRTTTADGRKIDNSDVVDTLSAALSGL